MIIDHDTQDVAVIRISVVQGEESDLSNPVGLSDKFGSSLWHTSVRDMGFGRYVDGGDINTEDGRDTGAGILRMADLPVDSVRSSTFVMGANGGQILWHGDSGGSAYTLTDVLGRALPGVAGVNLTSDGVSAADALTVDTYRRWIMQSIRPSGTMVPGQIRQSNIALLGGSGWGTVPVLFVDTDEEAPSFFYTTNNGVPNIPTWAQTAGVKAVSGDFNGDRVTDIALLGGIGWNTVPIDFAPSGGYEVTNAYNSTLSSLAQRSDARVTTGDIDGDGKTDIVVMNGASTVVTIGLAIENGLDGSFWVIGFDLGPFASNLGGAGVRLVSGDFDGDGRDDLAWLGNHPSLVSVAFSNGDTTFTTRTFAADLAGWTQTAGTKAVVGDFDGDGRDDIAVTGGPGWTDIRVAHSLGNGQFSSQSFPVANFPAWSQTQNVTMVSGDYNGDGRDDIALVGGVGWGTVPIAFSQPYGFFVTNYGTEFAGWAQASGVKVVSAH